MAGNGCGALFLINLGFDSYVKKFIRFRGIYHVDYDEEIETFRKRVSLVDSILHTSNEISMFGVEKINDHYYANVFYKNDLTGEFSINIAQTLLEQNVAKEHYYEEIKDESANVG